MAFFFKRLVVNNYKKNINNMKTIYIFLFFTTISYLNSNAQISKIWDQRYYSDSGNDELVADAQTDTSGNTFVTGTLYDSAGVTDIVIMKYNSSGIREWVQIYNDSSQINNYPLDLTLDPFGNVYVVGYNSHHTKNLILKYNGANGALLWKKVTVVTNTAPYPVKAIVNQANNLCVGYSGFSVAVLDFNGNSVTGYPAPAITNANCYKLQNLYVDNNNNLYKIGEVDLGFSCSNSNYLVQKVGSWAVNSVGTGGQVVGKNYATYMSTDNSGNNVYVVSQQGLLLPPDPSSEILVTKFNSSNGSKLWEYEIVGDVIFGKNFASGIKVDSQGNVLVLGTIENSSTNLDIVLTKLSPAGTLIWRKTYNNSFNTADGAGDLVIDNNSNIYITGKTKNSSGIDDFITLKYSSNGNLIWDIKYNGTINWNDQAFRIGIDNLNDVYVSGNSTDSTLYYSMMTVKYSCFVPSAPDSFLVSNISPCAGELNVPYSVNAQTGQTYTWTYTGSGVTFNGTSNSSSANFSNTATAGSIQVFSNNSCGASLNTLSLAINVNPQPAVTLSSFSPLCSYDSSISLTGGSPAGGAYSGSGVSGSIFDPTIAGIGTHTITYTYTDTSAGCAILATKPIVVSTCTGIAEIFNNEVNVSPNPNNGLFTVTVPNIALKSKLEIYNMRGEKVYQTQFNYTSNTEIDLSKEAKGIYFYRLALDNSNKVITGKLIVH